MNEHHILAFEQDSDGIIVRVVPEFLDDQSEPESDHFVWAYRVEVENHTDEAWQLVTRHWKIIDSQGRQQNVEGPGVIGEQPVIEPGTAFRYSSGAPLSSPSGMMQGSYDFVGNDGQGRSAAIPLFPLDSPYDMARPN